MIVVVVERYPEKKNKKKRGSTILTPQMFIQATLKMSGRECEKVFAAYTAPHFRTLPKIIWTLKKNIWPITSIFW